MAWSKNGSVYSVLPFSEQANDGTWTVLQGKSNAQLNALGWSQVPDEPPRNLVMDTPTFFMQFSAFEEAAIRDFAEAEPAQGEDANVTQGRKALRIMLRRLDAARMVNIAHPANQAGVDLLVSLGLISNARGQEIKKGALV